MKKKKVRILLAKPGLDGHDRGIKIIARALRDAGFEVIYTGLRQTPEMIAKAALQESADIVGLSILSGAHMELCPKIIEELKKEKLKAIILIGGVIPKEDANFLKELGVAAVFRPGTTTQEIIDFIKRQDSLAFLNY